MAFIRLRNALCSFLSIFVRLSFVSMETKRKAMLTIKAQDRSDERHSNTCFIWYYNADDCQKIFSCTPHTDGRPSNDPRIRGGRCLARCGGLDLVVAEARGPLPVGVT